MDSKQKDMTSRRSFITHGPNFRSLARQQMYTSLAVSFVFSKDFTWSFTSVMQSEVSFRSLWAFLTSAEFVAVSIWLDPKFMAAPPSPRPVPAAKSKGEAAPPVSTVAPNEISPDASPPAVPTACAVLQSFHTWSSLLAASRRLLTVCFVFRSTISAFLCKSFKSLASCSFISFGKSLILARHSSKKASIRCLLSWGLKSFVIYDF